jgi:hypothetical protein
MLRNYITAVILIAFGADISNTDCKTARSHLFKYSCSQNGGLNLHDQLIYFADQL